MLKKCLFIACLVFALPLVAEVKVLAFAGSTRKDSYNKKLIQQIFPAFKIYINCRGRDFGFFSKLLHTKSIKALVDYHFDSALSNDQLFIFIF